MRFINRFLQTFFFNFSICISKDPKWSKRKINLVLKKKYLEKFQYFMKISGKSYYRLQQFHKICLHIFPFQNILHLLLFSRKTLFYIFLRLSFKSVIGKPQKNVLARQLRKLGDYLEGQLIFFFSTRTLPLKKPNIIIICILFSCNINQ